MDILDLMGSRPGTRTGILAFLLLLVACSSSPEQPPDDAGSPSPSSPSSPSSPAAATPSHSRSADEPAPYVATVQRIGPALRHRMRFSHRSGCPVPLADLRYLRMTYLGFDGRAHTGEMVVHADHAEDVTEVFRHLYDARWPLRRMVLVDVYGGDDDRSMAADNTSSFNCRRVVGGDHWSDHAYGAAIDINPVQNPYVRSTGVEPPAGRPFATLDRSAGAEVPAGVIRSDDVVVRAFARIRWAWGGDWTSAKDYQHFSTSGR